MKNKWIIITAIITLGIVESVALINDINGSLLTLVVAAIAGLAGWVIPQPYDISLKGGAKNG